VGVCLAYVRQSPGLFGWFIPLQTMEKRKDPSGYALKVTGTTGISLFNHCGTNRTVPGVPRCPAVVSGYALGMTGVAGISLFQLILSLSYHPVPLFVIPCPFFVIPCLFLSS
jgi:hypothetical protein